MSATMARQGGQVQLRQSDMHLSLNMAKMANGRISRAAREETKYVTKTPRAEIPEEMKSVVEFPGYDMVKVAIDRHPAMLRYYQTDRHLPCPNGTAKNLQTRCRPKGTGASPPDWRRQQTPDPVQPLPGMRHLPRMPPEPPRNNAGAHRSQIVNLPAGYMYSHISIPCAKFLTLDAYGQDSQHYTDFDPDMFTAEGISSG